MRKAESGQALFLIASVLSQSFILQPSSFILPH